MTSAPEAAALLRAWLTRQGIRQQDLAKDLGISPNTVSRWMVGALKPTLVGAVDLEARTGGAVPAWAWVRADDPAGEGAA